MSANRKLLLIETSCAVGTVALARGPQIEERTIATPREQTGLVLSLVDALLQAAGLHLADLDALAFGRGPGSFTGLRVAAAVTQGLGLATAVPIVSVSSLAGLAQRALGEIGTGGATRAVGPVVPEAPERVLCCIDARMGEVYSGCFRRVDGLAEAENDEVIGPAEAVTAPLTPYLAVGDGFGAHADALAGIAAGASGTRPDLQPRARDLLPLALREMDAGRFLPVGAALPVYLRSADAWRKV